MELSKLFTVSHNSSRNNRYRHFIYFFDVQVSFACRYLLSCHVMTAEQQQILISSALINLLPNEYHIWKEIIVILSWNITSHKWDKLLCYLIGSYSLIKQRHSIKEFKIILKIPSCYCT